MGTSGRRSGYRSPFGEHKREAQSLIQQAKKYSGASLFVPCDLLERAVAAADRSENVELRVEARRLLAKAYRNEYLGRRRKYLLRAENCLNAAASIAWRRRSDARLQSDHHRWSEIHEEILREVKYVRHQLNKLGRRTWLPRLRKAESKVPVTPSLVST